MTELSLTLAFGLKRECQEVRPNICVADRVQEGGQLPEQRNPGVCLLGEKAFENICHYLSESDCEQLSPAVLVLN